MEKIRINNKNKNEQVLELFKSKQLVQYPSDQEILKQYQLLNLNELCIIQEIDESSQEQIIVQNNLAQKESIYQNIDPFSQENWEFSSKQIQLDLTLSQFPPLSDLETKMTKVKTKKQTKQQQKILEIEEKKEELMINEDVKSEGSFEDLQQEANETLNELQKQSENKEIEEPANVKLYMNEYSRLLEDDYFKANRNHQTKLQDSSGAMEKPACDQIDGQYIDWFQLYATKQFQIVNDLQFQQRIRLNIGKCKSISPQSKYYDQLALDPYKQQKNEKKEQQNGKIITDYIKEQKGKSNEEAMMASNINMGNSQKEKFKMRKQMLMRQSAWCVLLGIDFNSEQFANFDTIYRDVLINNLYSEDKKNEFVNQIRLDVNRTFRPYNLKFLSSDVTKGRNKLYNLLKVYALILDPEIGYTQGMNFLAALILMHVPNEILACQIFVKILEKDNWARMYIPSTPKLFDMSQNLMNQIKIEIPILYQHFIKYEIILEMILAGPLMTLFSNILNFSEATHVLNMFILDGENYMMKLLINIFKNMQANLLNKYDQFEIHAYMSKEMWEDAINQNKFHIE